MTIRLAIRGYVHSRLLFEEPVNIDETTLESLIPDLAMKHAGAMARGELTMIEMEFLDEADPLERFFRLGTDPAGMVLPLEVKL